MNTKLPFILIASILIIGWGSPKPKVPEVVELPPVVTTPTKFLSIGKCTNCSDAEWKFIQEAQIKVNDTVETSCFASFMLERKLIQTMNKTNEQVVQSLVDARITIDVTMYYSLKRVLGYTYEGVNKEWINRRYMMKWSQCDLASLLGHETSHKVGYDHDYYANASRPYSVPYSINEAIDKCCVK